jgi:hypothetical protein
MTSGWSFPALFHSPPRRPRFRPDNWPVQAEPDPVRPTETAASPSTVFRRAARASKSSIPASCRCAMAVFLVPGEARDVGDLTISTGATLAGRVVDEQGQGVEGALVEAKLAGRLARPSLRVTSDPKGEFFLRVPLGEYQLTAQTEALFMSTPLSIHVQGDVATDACILHLTARAQKPSLRH